jgi:hypothetical protein
MGSIRRVEPAGVVAVVVVVPLMTGGCASPQGGVQSASQAPGTIYGTPGAPTATVAIGGQQLPPPPPPCKIARNAAQSTPYWPARVVPPRGAPKALLIMTDDTGFGVSRTFGGVIPTPNLDRIAASGPGYTNFNSTALCSPRRAALITGRTHHSMDFGVVAEQSTGFPGHSSVTTRDKATIGPRSRFRRAAPRA